MGFFDTLEHGLQQAFTPAIQVGSAGFDFASKIGRALSDDLIVAKDVLLPVHYQNGKIVPNDKFKLVDDLKRSTKDVFQIVRGIVHFVAEEGQPIGEGLQTVGAGIALGGALFPEFAPVLLPLAAGLEGAGFISVEASKGAKKLEKVIAVGEKIVTRGKQIKDKDPRAFQGIKGDIGELLGVLDELKKLREGMTEQSAQSINQIIPDEQTEQTALVSRSEISPSIILPPPGSQTQIAPSQLNPFNPLSFNPANIFSTPGSLLV